MLTLVQVGASCKWVNDSQRLLLEWFDVMRDSPSQVYHLALPFCPSPSWLHECYATELLQELKVIKGLPAGWGTCSRTVAFKGAVEAFTYWKDTIAVGMRSGNIVTLDGVTGIQTATLSGHTGLVKTLSSLPDGTSLASGSDDKTVKLWDVQTGGVVKTFYGHTGGVVSVSISADYTMIASGSYDNTTRLWNIQTEECLHIIKQQQYVGCVRFSPVDPQHLVSVSGEGVWHWDINGHQTKSRHYGSGIAFSSDGTQIVFCQGNDVIAQNYKSGAIVAKFHAKMGMTKCCCFSPDGRLIAVGAGSTIYVWDTTSSHPHPIKTFRGHTNVIISLVFSSSSFLISSALGSVKFWQIGALQTDPVVTDLESTPPTSAWIQSITLQAEDGVVISSDSKGVVRTWDISTGHCKASFQIPAKSSHYRDVRLINSQLIFVWQLNEKMHIWDVEKGESLYTVDAEGDYVGMVRISGDGSIVFYLCRTSIQAWSIQTGEAVGKVGCDYANHHHLTVDGSRVWLHVHDSEPRGWDFGIPGSPPARLSGTSLVHPNNIELQHSRLWDTVTGKVVFQLAGRFANPWNSQWDGRYLVAGYESGEVMILDFNCVHFE